MGQFTKRLIDWHKHINTRTMPWKGEKDAYKIWLSEVILQQTKVEQGWKYYEAFVEKYPTIKQLAAAKDDEVFKLWEGLGYYSRCRNLLATARLIAHKYDGKFPERYEDILQLKGVGPYTAAAIASFAYNLPYAVLDGNVYRVLSRIYGIQTPTDTNEGKKQFQELAVKNLDVTSPALYNQAIMDFGATVCKPSPVCGECIMQDICIAFKENLVSHLPVKEKKLIKKDRYFTQFVIVHNNKVMVNKRTANDIWKDLHEFYVEESDKAVKWSDITIKQFLLERFQINSASGQIIKNDYRQQLTHQHIHTNFIIVHLSELTETLKNFQWINIFQIKQLAFPKTVNEFIEHNKFI